MYVCIFGPLRIPCEIDYELKLEASSSTDGAHKKMQTRLRELFPILPLWLSIISFVDTFLLTPTINYL